MAAALFAPAACSGPAALPRSQTAVVLRKCAPAARQELQAAPAAAARQPRRQRAAALVPAAGFGFGKAAQQKKLSKEKTCPCGSGLAFKARRGWDAAV